MERLTLEELRRLTEVATEPAVSIYFSTHRAGRDIRENSIRCKNLIRRAEEAMQSRDYDAATIRGILAPAEALIENQEFWRRQSDGLALFCGPDEFRSFRLPVSFSEVAAVGGRFHIKPLLQMLQNNGRFFILAVSQNDLRLFEASRFSADEVYPEGLPDDLETALNIDEYQQSLQHHDVGSAGETKQGGRGFGIFHGHGGADPEVRKKEDILQYFLQLREPLERFLSEESAPLVFAGVENLFPIFRQACNYKHLVGAPVAGNPDELDGGELHRQAWPAVEPIFEREREAALKRYGEAQANQLASDDLRDVVLAAQDGRVDVLFVREDAQQWGQVDAANRSVVAESEQKPHNEDLLDRAAAHTVRNSGIVYLLPAERMPGKALLAAVYRYSMSDKTPPSSDATSTTSPEQPAPAVEANKVDEASWESFPASDPPGRY